MSFTLIAETGDRFASFGPYVPSVNEAGVVAFQVTRPDGSTGVSSGDGAGVIEHDLFEVGAVTSHPDLTDEGTLSFYGIAASGGDRVILLREGVATAFCEGFHAVGPAGPTMNEDVAVAFRAERTPGVAGVYVAEGDEIRTIAETGAWFAGFHGLPLIDAAGLVVFRADRTDGVQGIYGAGGEPFVETGDLLATIGSFPSLAADGALSFAATTVEGDSQAFVVRDGDPVPAAGGEAFESHRGALLAGQTLIRIATPRGGRLGFFRGADPVRDRIVAIGDPLLGSTVEDLAANPVSVNAVGHLAIRVSLADGREAIVRADVA